MHFRRCFLKTTYIMPYVCVPHITFSVVYYVNLICKLYVGMGKVEKNISGTLIRMLVKRIAMVLFFLKFLFWSIKLMDWFFFVNLRYFYDAPAECFMKMCDTYMLINML